MTYVPKPVLIDLNSIMKQRKISKTNAFMEMASYAKVGMEAERILKFKFPNTIALFKKRKR